MRRTLDLLYRATLWASALCLLTIALMVGAQLGGRLIDGAMKLVGLEPIGIVILSLAEICSYLLGAASFLGLAGTLKAGAHIRVTMALNALTEPVRRYVELWAFGFAALGSAYMTYQLGHFAWVSFLFNEVSPGVIRVPLAYPQGAMALGAAVLTVALIDECVAVWRSGRPSFRATEDAVTLGKEG